MVWWWYIYFYGSYILNWTVNPFMIGYEESGHFTVKGKSWYSFKYNYPYYVVYLAVSLIFGGILLWTKAGADFTSKAGGILAVVIGLNLTFSLLWLAVVIGFGMIKIPIECWKNSDIEHQLNYCRYKVADNEDELIKVVAEKD